jgi:cytoskeleton protein RodZ
MVVDKPSNDCGRSLREARERRGVTLRQLANTTKISVSALEALERNDLSRLPGGIFSRAFVRSYASEVGLDPEETVREFLAQFPHDTVAAGHPTAEPVEDHSEVESDRRMATAFLWLIALSVPVAAVILYFGIAGRQAAVVAPPEPPALVKTVAELPIAPAPPPAEPVAAKTALSAPTEQLAVKVSTTRPCWLAATVDGERVIGRILQPGEQQSFDVRREILLTAGDAEALSITLNGAAARSLGKSGEVVTTRFTLTNFKDYLAKP